MGAQITIYLPLMYFNLLVICYFSSCFSVLNTQTAAVTEML